jgi:hypothetical protein
MRRGSGKYIGNNETYLDEWNEEMRLVGSHSIELMLKYKKISDATATS